MYLQKNKLTTYFVQRQCRCFIFTCRLKIYQTDIFGWFYFLLWILTWEIWCIIFAPFDSWWLNSAQITICAQSMDFERRVNKNWNIRVTWGSSMFILTVIYAGTQDTRLKTFHLPIWVEISKKIWVNLYLNTDVLSQKNEVIYKLCLNGVVRIILYTLGIWRRTLLKKYYDLRIIEKWTFTAVIKN